MRPLSSAPHVPESRSLGAESARAGRGGSVVTTILLALVLISGPLLIGAARSWVELPLLEVVALLLFVQGWRLRSAAWDHPWARLDLIDLSVVLFVLYAIARWATSPTEYFSRLEILSVFGYAVIFFTCRYGLARRTHGLVLLILLVALGVFETAFGYYLETHLSWCPFGPTELMHQYYAPRWVGTYGCPNHYGAILVMAMGAALAWGSFSKLSWPVRIVFFYLAAVMLAGVMCSGSRGSMLGAFAAIGALSLFGVRYGMVRWWFPVLGGSILLGGFVLVLSQSALVKARMEEVSTTLATGQLDHYVRFMLARDALKIWQDHPLFGTGPATFVFVHPRYQDNTFPTKAVLTHDDYLNCLDDYGAIGLAIALVFVVSVTVRFFNRPRGTSRWQDRVLLTAGFLAWSALLLHSLVDYNMHIPANAMMLFALTGMGLRRFSGEQEITRLRLALPLAPVAWLVLVLSLVYSYGVGRTAIGDLLFEHAQAQELDALPTDTIAALQEALKYDPHNVPDLVSLGDMYRLQAARQEDPAQRVSGAQLALDAYERAFRDNPLDDTIEASMGLTFDIMHRYAEAYICYSDALAHQPYDGQFWFRLGNHFWERGLLEKAEQAYYMGMSCPHGAKDNVAAAKEIRDYLAARGVPPPQPGTDPLKPAPEEPTIP
jgi:O-antigen ligase